MSLGMVNQRAGSGVAGDTLATQLNSTANITSSVLDMLSGPTFVFALSEAVGKRMIECIQDFFQATDLGKNFNRKLWSVNKEVVVQDQFSMADTQQLPQIVVNAVPADALPLSLGNRIGQETDEEDGALYQVYGGNANMSVTLELYDTGKNNVCQLADIVFLSMMQYVKDAMMMTQMALMPQIKFTAPSKVNVASVGGSVFRIVLTAQVVTEWRQYMKFNTVDIGGITTQSTADPIYPIENTPDNTQP